MSAAASIAAIFGRTDAGLLAGKVEELAWLAVPHAAGFRVLTAWQWRKPLAAWTPDDFYGAVGIVPDEAAFRALVEETAEHRLELSALGRQSLAGSIETPWGASQQNELYDEGVVFYSTASHGGFFHSPDRNVLVNARLRNGEAWYEEDGEWAKVAFTFPALFTTWERKVAGRTLRNDQPDAWEAILGVVLLPGESSLKDERQFRRDHGDRWIVTSAGRSEGDADMVRCIASLGGILTPGARREYLVPRAEYEPGRFGFVIDDTRHERTDQVAAHRA